MSNSNFKPTKPSHDVIVATTSGEGENTKTHYDRIGAAWPTKNGKGFRLKLNALPLDGTVLVLERNEKSSEGEVA